MTLFQRRFRGFRVIDLGGFACLATLVLGVYGFKAHAGGEGAKIAEVNGEITEQQRQIRMLDAELAHLEEPERLEALSSQYLNLAPIAAKHETTPDGLMAVARAASDPAPKTKSAPAGSVAAGSVAHAGPTKADKRAKALAATSSPPVASNATDEPQ